MSISPPLVLTQHCADAVDDAAAASAIWLTHIRQLSDLPRLWLFTVRGFCVHEQHFRRRKLFARAYSHVRARIALLATYIFTEELIRSCDFHVRLLQRWEIAICWWSGSCWRGCQVSRTRIVRKQWAVGFMGLVCWLTVAEVGYRRRWVSLVYALMHFHRWKSEMCVVWQKRGKKRKKKGKQKMNIELRHSVGFTFIEHI